MLRIDVVIIGGGQAGLAMSCCLARRGVEHVVLERGRVAHRWRSERWDSLRLLWPNWMSRLAPADRPSGRDFRRTAIHCKQFNNQEKENDQDDRFERSEDQQRR
jgi:cation diffusion facilitator CzcD-associated flavoprotein CzcO